MASAEETAVPTENYPSPSRAEPSLPFFHDTQAATARLHGHTEQSSGTLGPAMDPGSVEENSVPDDPELRSQLAGLVSGMNNGYSQYEDMQSVFTLQHTPANNPSARPAQQNHATTPISSKNKDRTKVSRACDECRRKKIRCDALDETGDAPCTNCTKSSSQCMFNRQPLKRGPSKGYIKDLADRLVSLEQQVHPAHTHPNTQVEIQQLHRAIGEASRDERAGFSPRAGEKRNREIAGPSSPVSPSRSSRAYNPQFLRSGEALPFWSQSGQESRRDTAGVALDADHAVIVTSFDWDEDVVAEYYRIIHQTFPLLPNSKTRLKQRLAESPSSLREAFLTALDCLMRTFPTTSLQANPGYPQALKRTAELLAKYPFENPSSHTSATNLVYLQTLLLMALESDNHGPATIRGQAGPSRAEWLGRAAGVAGQLEINVIPTSGQSVLSGDPDSEARLARRVWWVLFILDRWHASSTADLLKLPENSVVLLPEDQILLGESTYHLARLSFIIGHLAAILTTTKTPSTDVMARSNPASSLLVLTLAGEIDRFRESVESVWGSLNLVHVSYHHCHLLIKRLSPECEPTELVGHAVKVATVLNSRLTPVTPLNHHFGALAAMTLCELCDVPQTRDEAVQGLDAMIEALGEGRGLAGKLDSDGWDGAVRQLVVKKKERIVQSTEEENIELKFDPTMLTRYGYLTALGQGRFRTK